MQNHLLQKQNKAYKDFCEENDLKQLSERLKVAKWDRSQAAKARAAARKYDTPQDTLDIFKQNSAYKTNSNSFDLESAKKDYSDFLTTVPEKNRMLLQQSFESVEYKEEKLGKSPFGYSPTTDRILYDTSNEDFWRHDFTIANTHELAHRIDRFFVGSKSLEEFEKSILAAESIVDRNPMKFKLYCEKHDNYGFLSDILSAISSGKYEFAAGHPEEYWKRPGTKGTETFANLFSAEAFRDSDSINFLREYFPDIVRIYLEMDFGVI